MFQYPTSKCYNTLLPITLVFHFDTQTKPKPFQVSQYLDMGIRLPSVLLNSRQILKMQAVSTKNHADVPKGHIAVYVGEIQRKRFLVPLSYLNNPTFIDLLKSAEEEFGYNHPMGGLTIPCREDVFIDLTSRLHRS